MMSVEESVEWELAGETEVLGANVPQLHFVHHKSHMIWLGLEAGMFKLGWRNSWSTGDMWADYLNFL
jgi:hypothetical protein